MTDLPWYSTGAMAVFNTVNLCWLTVPLFRCWIDVDDISAGMVVSSAWVVFITPTYRVCVLLSWLNLVHLGYGCEVYIGCCFPEHRLVLWMIGIRIFPYVSCDFPSASKPRMCISKVS